MKTVKFTEMKKGTKDEYLLLDEYEQSYIKGTADRILKFMKGLTSTLEGYKITRLEHSLQTATRAFRDNADEEMVVAALLHDIGDELAPVNHSEYAIDRFWLVNAQGYSTKPSGFLTFTYIDNEWSAAGNVLAEANLGAQRFNDGAGLWGDMWAVVSSLNTASNVLVTPVFASSDMFAAWTLSDINDPLPVELVQFNADCQNNGTVKLSWTTASEINNDYFDVQKSFDASDFFSIGTVAGNGNSNTINYYEFIDEESGTAYYRLKQVDFDGKFDYSDVVVASCKTDNFEIKAYDNFSGFAVQVLANFSDKVTIEIVDTRGRLIASKSVNIIEGMNNFQLDENISTGIYFIRLNGEKMNESLKVFKR